MSIVAELDVSFSLACPHAPQDLQAEGAVLERDQGPFVLDVLEVDVAALPCLILGNLFLDSLCVFELDLWVPFPAGNDKSLID